MQLVFAKTARQDLRDIIDYIALENPAAAEKVFRAIVAVSRQLVDFPEMGHAGRLPDTRELAVAGLPYMIVYQVTRNAVSIIAVFHGARDLVRALAERRKTTGR
ncbi:MAG: type II toxin-antitoxin system RelE/ParE family toxin [Rhodanobacteraceae bacterium]|nr:MAG: type II toxin-antitoxin system RelE/ParE family toxin [Rhodanobacteraceae bacterium]